MSLNDQSVDVVLSMSEIRRFDSLSMTQSVKSLSEIKMMRFLVSMSKI